MYFFIFFIFILIMIVMPTKSVAKRKGAEGEKAVIKKLSKLSKKYIILNDLLLDNKNKTSQIDHIVISSKGVFVIETKNYAGKIYAYVNDKYWLQSINGYKNNFYNPVWQNNTHIRAVKQKLSGFEEVPIHSIVVFCGPCRLKRIRGNKEKNKIIYLKRLNKCIKYFKADRILSDKEMNDIASVLNKNNIRSSIKRHQHVKNIKKNIK